MVRETIRSCIRGLSIVLVLAASTPGEPAPDSVKHDFIFDRHEIISISGPREGKYRFTLVRDDNLTYLTQNSLSTREFNFTTSSSVRAKNIKLFLNGVEQGKSCVESAPDEDQDVFLSESREYTLSLPHEPKIGDVVRYTYERQFEDINYLPLVVIPNVNYLNSATITFRHPEGVWVKPIFSKSFDTVAVRADRGSDKITEFLFGPMEKQEPRPYFPFNGYRAAILFEITDHGKPVNAVTPADFMAWYRKSVNLEPPLDSTARSLLETQVAAAGNDLGKIEAIYDWVRTNIHYIADMSGQHEIFPHLPNYILGARFGDCKDRAYLVAALAHAFGFKISMGSVSTHFMPEFDGQTHFGLANHVICTYDHDGTTTFFDPTATYYPFGEYPDAIVSHQALVLDTANPRLATVLLQDSLPELEMVVDAHVDSLASATARITIRGDLLGSVRYWNTVQTASSKARLTGIMISGFLIRMPVSDPVIEREEPHTGYITAKVDLSHFVMASPKRLYLPRTPLVFISQEIMKREKDSLPVYFDDLQNVSLSVTLRGAGLQVTADSLVTATSWGDSFVARCRQDSDGVTTATYSLRRLRKIIRQPDKAELLSFVQSYLTAKSAMFPIEEGKK